MKPPGPRRKALRLIGVVLALAVAAGLFLGRMAVEKIVTVLMMPCGVIWMLITGAAIWSYSAGDKRSARRIAVIWLIYSAAGNGILCSILVRSLESEYALVRPLQESPFDVVVVLGGGAQTGANGRHQGNASGDRLILAAQLFHQKVTPRLICTGQRITSMNSSGVNPAAQSADVLKNLGVPDEAIDLVGGRNTSEEMQNLGDKFRNSELRIGVVSSAWHLPRATRLARQQQLKIIPLPADFLSGPPRSITTGETVLECIPQGGTFMVMSHVLKEHLAMLVGR